MSLRLVPQSAVDAGRAPQPGEIVYDMTEWTARIHPATELAVACERKTRIPFIMLHDHHIPQRPDLHELLEQLHHDCDDGSFAITAILSMQKWLYGVPYAGEPLTCATMCITSCGGERSYIVIYEQHADIGTLSAMFDEPDLGQMRDTYVRLKTPRCQMVASLTDKQIRNIHLGRLLLDGWCAKKIGRLSVFEGPCWCAPEQGAVFIRRGYNVLRFSRDDWDDGVAVADGRTYTTLANALFRWPYSRDIIIRAALIFWHLPAYVLLWILDWLPSMHLWPEYRKIGLIQSVYASIGRATSVRNKLRRR